MNLELIIRKPDGKSKVTRCFLCTANGTAPGAGMSISYRILSATDTTVLPSACADMPAAKAARSCAGHCSRMNLPNELLEKYHANMQDESFRAYLDELGLNLDRTQRVKTPLLVIGAENDAVIKHWTVRRTANVYGTQAIIFSNMAHDVMLETGWEKVAETILKWLNKRGF